MNQFSSEMAKVVDRFVSDVTAIAKEQAIHILESALRGATNGNGNGSGHGHGSKRSSDALDGLSSKFRAFVEKNPGLRIEQINKQLGTSTKELSLPIRKMIASGVIKTKGAKRTTTYFAGKREKD